MASRLQTSWRLASSLVVAAMAVAGLTYAQTVNEGQGGKVNVRCEGSTGSCLNPAGGSLRSAPADEPATPSGPAPSAPHATATPADEAPDDADAAAEESSEGEPEPGSNDEA
ncbi:hypothetical protein [Brevundimonas subvibrioides]|uniref:Uncharacterized protein n=1 Tax=Brevundimonas subvibrioides (strain ATCC 15264 / DSM 4735 / LMG 14903 / NBRC 16000 / CB 81) TaxID=633149 RepID=D9QLG5_BRESC|nr:hypothetical protein [Brevundimonas subvibrioides]ADL01859.1 conserved hypothetical protein [Brevundimonas subvibrioides ATCC 15264]